MNAISETTIAWIKFWTVYGTAHYAQSVYTQERAMQDYTKRLYDGTLYPPEFLDGWRPGR